MITILNSSVLTAFGTYRYTSLKIEEAKNLLLKEGFISTVGHKETAELLSKIMGLKIDYNRIDYIQKTGGKALVFKIKKRLQVAQIIEADELETEEYEIGLLERIQ